MEEIKKLMMFAKASNSSKESFRFLGKFAVSQLNDNDLHLLLLEILKEKSHINLVRPIFNELIAASRYDGLVKELSYLKESKKKTFEVIIKQIPLETAISRQGTITGSDGKLVKNTALGFSLESVRILKSIYFGEDKIADRVRVKNNNHIEVRSAIVFLTDAYDLEKTPEGKREILKLVDVYLNPLLQTVSAEADWRGRNAKLYTSSAFAMVLNGATESSGLSVAKESMLKMPEYWSSGYENKYISLRLYDSSRDNGRENNDSDAPFINVLLDLNNQEPWFKLLVDVAEKVPLLKTYIEDMEYYLSSEAFNNNSIKRSEQFLVWNQRRSLNKISGHNVKAVKESAVKQNAL